jgi:hypothetical protein
VGRRLSAAVAIRCSTHEDADQGIRADAHVRLSSIYVMRASRDDRRRRQKPHLPSTPQMTNRPYRLGFRLAEFTLTEHRPSRCQGAALPDHAGDRRRGCGAVAVRGCSSCLRPKLGASINDLRAAIQMSGTGTARASARCARSRPVACCRRGLGGALVHTRVPGDRR